MKKMWLAGMALVLAGCGGGEPEKAAVGSEETHNEAFTHWSETAEVFGEYAPLVAGETSRFAIHVTRLDNFRPVEKGRVEVKLRGGDGREEAFAAEAPSWPGIFGVDVKAAGAGEYGLAIEVAGEVKSRHELGKVTVYGTRAGAAHDDDHEHRNGSIAFTKEQQWTLDFATAVVASRRLRESLRVPAEVKPRSGGEAEVTVPFDGRLIAERMPVVGTRVSQGEVLAQLLPPTSTPSDLSSLELGRKEAELALQLARKDRERAERLVEAGAAPAKRLDEARTVEATVQARLKAAETRLGQYEASSTAERNPLGAKLFALRAPIGGIVVETGAAPNTNVKAGETLFHIVDADSVYISAIVPEAELARIGRLSGAQLEIPGTEELIPLTKLVSIGRMVDAASRTFPVIYALDNRGRKVAIHQTLHVRLLLEETAAEATVPETALVDDSGRPVVYVQKGGEEFVRRPVRVGVRESGLAQILEGVEAGERVVTRGAHLLRLASLSTQAPAEGHVH